MEGKTYSLAQQFGIYKRLEAITEELQEDMRIVEVDYDLNNLLDGIRQVIVLVKYHLPASTPMYFAARKDILCRIIQILKSYGLTNSGDKIEDHGEHYYIVRDCDTSWPV